MFGDILTSFYEVKFLESFHMYVNSCLLLQVIKGRPVMNVAMDYKVLMAHQAIEAFQVYNIIKCLQLS